MRYKEQSAQDKFSSEEKRKSKELRTSSRGHCATVHVMRICTRNFLRETRPKKGRAVYDLPRIVRTRRKAAVSAYEILCGRWRYITYSDIVKAKRFMVESRMKLPLEILTVPGEHP